MAEVGTATIAVNADTTELLAGLAEVETAIDRITAKVAELQKALQSIYLVQDPGRE
jgi:hypothetical protein